MKNFSLLKLLAFLVVLTSGGFVVGQSDPASNADFFRITGLKGSDLKEGATVQKPNLRSGGAIPDPRAVDVPAVTTDITPGESNRAEPVRLEIDEGLQKDRGGRREEAAAETDQILDAISPTKLSLLDAVRLTLASNPEIGLAVEDANSAKASLVSILGTYDTRLTYNQEYRNDTEELTDKEKQKERERYAITRELNDTAQIALERIDRVLAGDTSAADFSLEGTPLNDPNSTINNPGSQANNAEFQSDRRVADLERRQQEALSAIVNRLTSGSGLGDEIDDLATEAIRLQKDIFKEIERSTARALRETPPWIVNRKQTHNYELALSKRFRGGPNIRSYARMGSSETNAGFRADQPRVNRAILGTEFSVNILKLGDIDGATAQERAAEEQIKAQEDLARAQVADSVRVVIKSYWRLAAAQESLERQVESELETLAIGALSRQLVDGDVIPKVDLAQVQAREFQAVGRRYAAEIALYVAQQEFAVSLGIDPEDALEIPLAADSLPDVDDLNKLNALTGGNLLSHALSRHPDVLAFRSLLAADRILIRQAQGDLRPDFELYTGAEFAGYNEESGLDGYYDVFSSNLTGASFFVGGRIDWPLENRGRKAELSQRMIALSRNNINLKTAKRFIATEVATSRNRIKSISRQLSSLEDARKSLEDSIDIERKKLEDGDSTLINVLFTEQNLTSARLAEISARSAYAQALADYRYATYTIMPDFEFSGLEGSDRRRVISISSSKFTTLPGDGDITPVSGPVEPGVPFSNAPGGPIGRTAPKPLLVRASNAVASVKSGEGLKPESLPSIRTESSISAGSPVPGTPAEEVFATSINPPSYEREEITLPSHEREESNDPPPHDPEKSPSQERKNKPLLKRIFSR